MANIFPLYSPETAERVRVRDGHTIVTDRPFAETRVQRRGNFLVEALNIEDGIAIAVSIPGSLRGTAEIPSLLPMSN